MPQAISGIEQIALFPIFSSRQAYRDALGKEAPPYDPSRPPKNWFDPAAATTTRRSVVYEMVLALTDDGRALAGPDGKPELEPLVLRREEAATVNIYADGLGFATPNKVPVPAPLRALKPNEELQFGFGGQVIVRDLSIPLPSETDGFNSADRATLQAIAEKLGLKPGAAR
ncbi:MAG: hypothetical protein NTZ56_21670 [Acidobacteria bacterium]|nr:hypothetical protein [Acidobacteriota bacterium]